MVSLARVKIVITQRERPADDLTIAHERCFGDRAGGVWQDVHERCRVRRRWLLALGEIQNQPGGALDLPIGGLVDAWFSQQGV